MGSCTWLIFWCSVLCCLTLTACAGTAKKFTSTDHIFTDGDIHGTGPYKVQNLTDVTSISKCCPLMIATPKDIGVYPVVQFQHGTSLRNTDYSELISRVASWGFIVVATQMYNPDNPFSLKGDASSEIENARAVLSWMQTGLVSAMHEQGALATPNFSEVALVGHSRGALVVFALALSDSSNMRQYSAVVGLDPVDGQWPLLKPVLLENKKPDSLNVGVATLIVGTGLGPTGIVACAPEKRGHEYFYSGVKPPSFHFVAPDYGHMDFMNDNCRGVFSSNSLGCKVPCKSTESSRQPMRNFTSGILVAFLQKVLLHNNSAFDAACNHTEIAPIRLYTPESKGTISAMPMTF